MTLPDEERVRVDLTESFLLEKRVNGLIPDSGCLLEPIEALVEAAHIGRVVRVDESLWLGDIDLLFELSIEKCSVHIHQMEL